METVLTVALGCVLGFIIGRTGVGGGALVAPALYVLLGIPYTQSVGISLVYSLFTKIVGVTTLPPRKHRLEDHLDIWARRSSRGLDRLHDALPKVSGSTQRLFPLLMGGILLVVSGLAHLG